MLEEKQVTGDTPEYHIKPILSKSTKEKKPWQSHLLNALANALEEEYHQIMENITEELIKRATAVVNPQYIGDRLIGDVGCALITDQGNVYVGVCLDTASGTGFCAEASAIAAMVTAAELRISQIVAVWKDEQGSVFVLSPCGRCREFLRQIHEENLDTDVVLARESIVKLRQLLPHPNQFVPLESLNP